MRDGDEFEKEMEVPKIEKGGYLHGKKILHDESESGGKSEAGDVNAETGSCLFKGMSAGIERIYVGDDAPMKNGTLQ